MSKECDCPLCIIKRAIEQGRPVIVVRISDQPEDDCDWRKGKNGQPVPVFVKDPGKARS